MSSIGPRLDDLEARYAFQEDQLRQLDQVVRELGDQVARLTSQVSELRVQLAEVGDEGKPNSLQDEVPPHY
jgi:uncharacterized coiled-coil protein SlyX